MFLDDEGRIKQLPVRGEAKQAVLAYLAEKFFCDRDYTQKEVNAIISDWHTFGDYFLLRRELIDAALLGRERDGSRYWKEKTEELSEKC
jgi:hypothetical protein